jgi:DNA modification methylase
MNEGKHIQKSDEGLPLNDCGRNKRSVWEVSTQPFSLAHFATFPPALIEPCILAGCPKGGVVLDPFGGAGTTGLVADRLQRNAILIELNPEYAAMARKRIDGDAPLFATAE